MVLTPKQSKRSCPLTLAIGAALLLAAVPAYSDAESSSELRALREELRALRERIVVLEKRAAAAESRGEQRVATAETAKKPSDGSGQKAPEALKEPVRPLVVAGDYGFALKTPDDRFVLRIGGYLQVDGRFFVEGEDAIDTFLVRRARPILEGRVFKDFAFRLMPDFGNGRTELQDAFIDYLHFDAARLRVGKFKPPVGLERLQSATDLRFVERGLPTDLVPNRDVGVQLSGELFKSVVEYQVGVFNGTPDGTSVDRDVDDFKDVAARLWLRPFKETKIGPLVGLGVGVAGTYGRRENAPLGVYVTPGQEVFFRYDDDVEADGEQSRIVPQLFWTWKSVGILGEYVRSSEQVRRFTEDDSHRVDNEAWQIEAFVALTGEYESFKSIEPKRNVGDGGFGAWELAVRYGQLNVDNDAFRFGLADPARSARRARNFGVSLNWYLNTNVKAMLDYEHTDFDGGDPNDPRGDREDEDVIFTRLQLRF